MHWYLDPILKHYADFTGRSTRKEFGMFVLLYVLFAVGVELLDIALGIGFLYPLFILAMLLPYISISARRCHDLNHSGWWVLMYLIPIVGIALLVGLLVQKGKVSADLQSTAGSIPTPGVSMPPASPDSVVTEMSQEVPVEEEPPIAPKNT